MISRFVQCGRRSSRSGGRRAAGGNRRRNRRQERGGCGNPHDLDRDRCNSNLDCCGGRCVAVAGEYTRRTLRLLMCRIVVVADCTEHDCRAQQEEGKSGA